MKRYAIGDIHGSARALKQCIEKSGADINQDRFIVVGDVCDGWPEVKESVDILMSMKNLVYILGNHDEWALNWMKYGVSPDIWISQGGSNTRTSYQKNGLPIEHIKFFEKAKLFHEEDGDLFVHGGIEKGSKAIDNDRVTLLWDRDLATRSAQCQTFKDSDLAKPNYKRIFIGHSTTSLFKKKEPIYGGHIWNLDTGAGWEGKLTIMDIDTEKWWQSDESFELYPNDNYRF
jgi:serine/threonine protein phosphatase 1